MISAMRCIRWIDGAALLRGGIKAGRAISRDAGGTMARCGAVKFFLTIPD